MNRTLWLLPVLVLTSFNLAEAQQPKKVPRIGYLSSGDAASESTRFEGIRLALRERGYIEGPNIVTEYRFSVRRHCADLAFYEPASHSGVVIYRFRFP